MGQIRKPPRKENPTVQVAETFTQSTTNKSQRKNYTYRLSPQVARDLKIYALQHEMSASDVVENFIITQIQNNPDNT